jgi:hypothetical protein
MFAGDMRSCWQDMHKYREGGRRFFLSIVAAMPQAEQHWADAILKQNFRFLTVTGVVERSSVRGSA